MFFSRALDGGPLMERLREVLQEHFCRAERQLLRLNIALLRDMYRRADRSGPDRQHLSEQCVFVVLVR